MKTQQSNQVDSDLESLAYELKPPAENAKKQQLKTNNTTEIGGRDGLEPTRYGDWEKNGRCIDF